MKKHGLLKTLGAILLLVIIASYALDGRGDAKDYIGFGDVLFRGFQSLWYFYYIIFFIVAIGGFYGVLNKIPAYKKLQDNIVTKVKKLGKKFIIVTILIFAVVTSITGITIPLLIFVPFVMSLIILLGYDKLVAVSSTIVSMMIGYIGGVFVTFYNPLTEKLDTYESFVGLDSEFGNVFPKLLLLFSGITLLIYFVSNHIKNVEKKKVKYELNDNEEIQINEVTSDYTTIKTWPMTILFILLFVVLVLGLFPWKTLFDIKVFEEFHKWLMELSIKDFAIIPNIISSDLVAFGEWFSTGDTRAYMIVFTVLFIFTILFTLIGRIKINDAIDGFVDGMKKTIPTAGLILVALTILICAYPHGFLEAIINSYGKFNYGISSLLVFLGCILNVDLYYVLAGVFSPIIKLITDESVYPSVAILFQGIYGIFSIVGPTSIILIFGLSYLNVPYTTWLKYIWRFILSLIVLLALVTLLVIFL